MNVRLQAGILYLVLHTQLWAESAILITLLLMGVCRCDNKEITQAAVLLLIMSNLELLWLTFRG